MQIFNAAEQEQLGYAFYDVSNLQRERASKPAFADMSEIPPRIKGAMEATFKNCGYGIIPTDIFTEYELEWIGNNLLFGEKSKDAASFWVQAVIDLS